MSRTEPGDLVERGRRVLVLEADAIRRVAERLGPPFAAAVRLLAKAKGRIIVSGVGKSGLIARKIAATFTSTGTPATFLHPVDSLHGDLGIVGRDDAALVLSKSGASEELFGLLQQLKRLGVPLIALTGDTDAALARQADVVLDAGVTAEHHGGPGAGRRPGRCAARDEGVPSGGVRGPASRRRARQDAAPVRRGRDALA